MAFKGTLQVDAFAGYVTPTIMLRRPPISYATVGMTVD
jgi:hypothetical protein